ncbi:hypothetical protein OAN47_03540 [Planctomycetota bacterium]|nr:hypothetical protein [Planctomycetota bacterium]
MGLSDFEKAGLAAAKREESRKKWQQRIGAIRRWVCSDKFWLHLAAVAALTVIITPWVYDLRLQDYVSHYWFVGFCLLMYAIRKNPKG